MTTGLLHALRVLHVVGGAFWFGAAVMNAAFLVPAVGAAGPAGGVVMRQLMAVRKLSLWITAAAWTSILSGVWLYGWRSAWFSASWLGTSAGVVYGVGGVLALIAAVIGNAVIGRSARELTALAGSIEAADGPPPADAAARMGTLQRRVRRAGVVAAILLALSVAAMAVARYT